MVEHHSYRIQNIIQKELFKANRTIKIAVAWFTNELLFQPLLLKLKVGVSVEIILNKDRINTSRENGLDFSEFVEAGGLLHWNDSERLMHDKFCIIDDAIVISGSYNWTNKAEYNDETITVYFEEKSTIDFYNKKFSQLCKLYGLTKNDGASLNGVNTMSTYTSSNNRHETEYIIEGSNPFKFNELPMLNFYDRIYCLPNGFDNPQKYIMAGINDKYTILDKDSLLPIYPFRFEEVKTCNGNGSYIWVRVNDKWGLFDVKSKAYILRPQFNYISRTRESDNCDTLITIQNGSPWDGGKYGAVNDYGKIIIDCIYEKLYGDGCYYEGKLNGKFGLLDKNGRVVLDFKYDKLNCCKSRGQYPSLLNGKYGVFGYGGKLILDFEYDKIEYCEPFGCGYHVLVKNGKFGIHICSTGEIIPCKYNSRDEVPDFKLIPYY